MKHLIRFHAFYFLSTLLILGIEMLIALYAHDTIIRPYGGDVLVVMLIYSFVKSFVNTPVLPTAFSVLLLAVAIESLQYIKIVNRLGLQHSTLATVVIGTSFSWLDIASYVLGIAVVVVFEKVR